MAELDLNPEIVCWIAARAREFQAQETVDLGGAPESLDNDMAAKMLSDNETDLLFQETKATIDDLEPDQQMSLVALMWLGRGDYTTDDWEDLLRQARQEWTPRTAAYFLATPLVADYLEEGLSLLGHSCTE